MPPLVKPWSEIDPEQVRDLYLRQPALPHAGTPLADDRMREYLFERGQSSAADGPERALAVVEDGTLLGLAQFRPLPYLVDWFGIECAGIDPIVYAASYDDRLEAGMAALFGAVQDRSREAGVQFVTLNVPASAISVIRALEGRGFHYAEGYLQLVSDTNTPVEEFEAPGLVIRDAVEADLDAIRDVYSRVAWPSHLTTEPGFDEETAYELYFEQMRKVYERQGERVVLMIGELDGEFAAALIGIVDEDLYAATGILTNPRHGMALVVHPRARRRGVSLHLVAARQRWYRDLGVEWVDFTPNFNNVGMIRSLERLGFRYGSVRATFHAWL